MFKASFVPAYFLCLIRHGAARHVCHRGRACGILGAVLADLEAFYDGYHFLPGAEPLYNSTICNWYLFNFVSNKGKQPSLVIDSNVRTDIGWIRRLAQTHENALGRLRAYVERGEGEEVDTSALSAKFGRAKFFSEEFFPYALYYLGLLTFEDDFTLNIPNLTIKNMFARRPDWNHPIKATVVEVCGGAGYNWFDLPD